VHKPSKKDKAEDREEQGESEEMDRKGVVSLPVTEMAAEIA
jgi:hypothetical protein